MNNKLVENIKELISQCNYEELESTQRMVNSMWKTLDRHYLAQIKVGSVIVFDWKNETIVGTVIRVNTKTVTFINSVTKRKGRVSTSLIVKGSRKMEEN